MTDLGRCTSTGRKCDGYPKAKAKDTFQIQVFADNRTATKLQPSISLLSGLGDSVRYLEFYYQCAAPSLSSRFDREFWSKISLQMAQSEPAIRHAVIALGYLNKQESGSLKHARSELQAIHGNKVFLYHYNLAVRSLVERMTQPSWLPEVGLVTCLLFVCIEFLRGNYHTGFCHFSNGLRLIREWRQQKRIDTPIQDVTLASASSDLIEDTLLPMFLREATAAQLYGVATEDHLDIPFPDPDSFIRRPFTLQEAERSSCELRNASVLLLRRIGLKHILKQKLVANDYNRQARLNECHRMWFETEQQAERDSQRSEDDRVSMSNLKVFLYATMAYIGCAASVLQVSYDAYLDAFKALVHHAEIVLNGMTLHKTHAAKFTFEMSIIPPLYHTATRCRCPITRRKAVSLLARGPPREGLWDAEQHVLVLNRVIEMEESELDPETGWPVERTRLWSSVIDANMDAQGGFWAYFLPSEWVGVVDATGKQRLIQERFNL